MDTSSGNWRKYGWKMFHKVRLNDVIRFKSINNHKFLQQFPKPFLLQFTSQTYWRKSSSSWEKTASIQDCKLFFFSNEIDDRKDRDPRYGNNRSWKLFSHRVGEAAVEWSRNRNNLVSLLFVWLYFQQDWRGWWRGKVVWIRVRFLIKYELWTCLAQQTDYWFLRTSLASLFKLDTR